MEPIFLMLITLNALNGDEISRKIEGGPYQTVEECVDVQRTKDPERVVLTSSPPQAVVHECTLSHVDKTT